MSREKLAPTITQDRNTGSGTPLNGREEGRKAHELDTWGASIDWAETRGESKDRRGCVLEGAETGVFSLGGDCEKLSIIEHYALTDRPRREHIRIF